MLLDSPSGRRELEVHIRPVRDIDFDGFVITGEMSPKLGCWKPAWNRRVNTIAHRAPITRGDDHKDLRQSARPQNAEQPGPRVDRHKRLRRVERQPRPAGGDEILQVVQKLELMPRTATAVGDTPVILSDSSSRATT